MLIPPDMTDPTTIMMGQVTCCAAVEQVAAGLLMTVVDRDPVTVRKACVELPPYEAVIVTD